MKHADRCTRSRAVCRGGAWRRPPRPAQPISTPAIRAGPGRGPSPSGLAPAGGALPSIPTPGGTPDTTSGVQQGGGGGKTDR